MEHTWRSWRNKRSLIPGLFSERFLLIIGLTVIPLSRMICRSNASSNSWVKARLSRFYSPNQSMMWSSPIIHALVFPENVWASCKQQLLTRRQRKSSSSRTQTAWFLSKSAPMSSGVSRKRACKLFFFLTCSCLFSFKSSCKLRRKARLLGYLAVVFDGSGKDFDLNHRTFFFPTLEFVRRLRKTTQPPWRTLRLRLRAAPLLRPTDARYGHLKG